MWAIAAAVTVLSAIAAKEASTVPLAVVQRVAPAPSEVPEPRVEPVMPAPAERRNAGDVEVLNQAAAERAEATFNGRPIRPARVVWMKVTAYSPGPESCAPYADGRTATLHSVWTNAMNLVAADTSILPFGSLVSVPGYDEGRVVPVLDRGAAIKGHELDVLFPTARQARKWGVQTLPIVVWEYADGLPAGNPRAMRDGQPD